MDNLSLPKWNNIKVDIYTKGMNSDGVLFYKLLSA